MNDMATKVAPSGAAQVMILNARDEWGSRNPVSEGAVALAEWLVRHGEEPRANGLAMFVGGHGNVQRMLADDLVPGMEWGEELGRMTGGSVISKKWLHEYDGAVSRPIDLTKFETLPPGFEVGQLAATSFGVLGTVPTGPLFGFDAVDGEPNVRRVRGMGVGLELTEALLCAMRDTCDAAIADIRGGVPA